MNRALQRTIEMYDLRRSWFPAETEGEVRHKAIDWLSRSSGLEYVRAAELLADALAKRALNRHHN